MSAILPTFNPTSPEYRAVLFAGKGEVEKLKTTIQENPGVLANRVSMLSSEDSFWTAGHYAVGGGHWQAVALLINAGMNWNLTSSTLKNPEGSSAVKVLGAKKGCLVEIFTELSRAEAAVNIEPLIELLLSDEIDSARRLELLQKPELCRAFSTKVKPNEALLIMMLLMKGCSPWVKEESPFPVLSHPNLFQWDSCLESLQGILYAFQLTSMKTPKEIEAEFVLKGMPFPLEISLSFERGGLGNFQTRTSPENREQLFQEMNSAISKNLGLPERSPAFEYHLQQERAPVQLYCMVNENGYAKNYGLLFRHRGQDRVICFEGDLMISQFSNEDDLSHFMFCNFANATFEGRPYQIETLDHENFRVYLTPKDPKVIQKDAATHFANLSANNPTAKIYTFPAP